MVETSMRGTRLGASSLECEDKVPPAARVAVLYVCSRAHDSLIPISVEAEEIPTEWNCRCGGVATRPNFEPMPKAPVRYVRSHWDMLLERRTLKELKALYDE